MQSMKSVSKDELISIVNRLCKQNPEKQHNIGTLFEIRTIEHPNTVHSVIVLNSDFEIL